MKLSKREKILLILVAILVVGAVYYFYFLTPYMNDMTEIKKEMDAKTAELNTLNAQNGELAKLEAELNEMETQNKEILEKIPTGFDSADLLQYIYNLVNSHAAKTQYNFEQPMDLVKIDSVRAVLSFYTDYENLKAIVLSLKTCKFNNRIIAIDATTKKPNTGEGTTENANTVSEDNKGYELNVLLTVEFFNLKGDVPADKKYDFGTGSKGKSDLFS